MNKTVISNLVQTRIHESLDQIERDHDVRVLFACESGSRAWGFASQDSDYDARFVYVNRPEWYLSIQHKRDVIEQPIVDDLDINGWDWKKALRLFRKSNPPLLEWLRSPIVYREEFSAAEKLRSLMATYFSPRSCMHHYLHMAEGNLRQYLTGDEIWTKKYFYVLRPVLACRWIEAKGTMPPTEFEKVLDDTVDDKGLRAEINRLLEQKMAGEELRRGPRVPLISGLLESEVQRFNEQVEEAPKPELPPYEALDELFREVLREVWENMPT